MTVKYNIQNFNEILKITLETVDLNENNVSVFNTIKKSDIAKLGNLIDRKAFPGKFCFILLKEFQLAINKKLMTAADIITNDKLKGKLVEYGQKIMTSEIEVVSPELFKEMVDEFAKYTDNV